MMDKESEAKRAKVQKRGSGMSIHEDDDDQSDGYDDAVKKFLSDIKINESKIDIAKET